MNIFLMIYLGGVGLKLIYNLCSPKRSEAVNNFNDTVLWPLYLLFDLFMFIVMFFKDED